MWRLLVFGFLEVDGLSFGGFILRPVIKILMEGVEVFLYSVLDNYGAFMCCVDCSVIFTFDGWSWRSENVIDVEIE